MMMRLEDLDDIDAMVSDEPDIPNPVVVSVIYFVTAVIGFVLGFGLGALVTILARIFT